MPVTTIPSDEDTVLARQASRQLSELNVNDKPLEFQLECSGVMIPVPAAAARVLEQALIELGAGHAVTLVPIETEITTQQAADLLSVSRPFLVGLIDKGSIPGRMVGSHRRLRLQDVLDYKSESTAKAKAAMSEMVGIGQELGLE